MILTYYGTGGEVKRGNQHPVQLQIGQCLARIILAGSRLETISNDSPREMME